jgi:hypothetical protein
MKLTQFSSKGLKFQVTLRNFRKRIVVEDYFSYSVDAVFKLRDVVDFVGRV